MHRMQSLIFYNGVSLATAPKFRIPNSEFRIFVEIKDLDKFSICTALSALRSCKSFPSSVRI